MEPERPAGSKAKLNDVSSPAPTFVADTPGEYVATLRVNNGSVPGSTDETVVTAASRVLSCGLLLSGTIQVAGQIDTYTFTGQVNQIITVTLANTTTWAYGTTAEAIVLLSVGERGPNDLCQRPSGDNFAGSRHVHHHAPGQQPGFRRAATTSTLNA